MIFVPAQKLSGVNIAKVSNVGDFPGVEFYGTAPKFKKGKKNFSFCVNVRHNVRIGK